MIATALLTLMICVIMAWCYYDLRESRKRLDEMTDRLDYLFDKELDNFRVSSYNRDREREEYIERMTKLKLVYNADTDAWDKLKELEE